ncbi:MAG: amidase [Proteobacteria bacterium]|nr:amidase [Pseudomonadota bacterium]
MSAELAYASATDLLRRYRAKELSPVEVAQAVLARIAALNPRLNAFCLVDEAGALASARESEARWMKGAPLGLLDGVPATIKDIVLTRGWTTLRGSRTVDPAGPWTEDAPATARMRENGAVLLGKTCTPEFGWKGVTDNPLTGITRNPWNTALTPGGSSGGASAQVAAGLGPLALGTDGGGSIRIPCAFTGISGIKPSFGRVPAWPLSPFGSVAHLGPMARTVADCALMLNVLSQPDVRDWTALPYAGIDWTQGLDAGVKGLRIAYSPRLGYVKQVHPDIEARVAEAAKAMAGLGAKVEEVDPGFADCRDIFRVHWTSGAYNLLRKMPPEKFALLDPGLQQACASGSNCTLAQYLDAVNARGALGELMKRFHQKYDLLLTPATAVPAFGVGMIAPAGAMGRSDGAESDRREEDWTWWTPFSFPFNLTQQPAMSVPCGFTRDGLPVGLQLVGPMHREDLVLRAANAYQQSTGHHLIRPAL